MLFGGGRFSTIMVDVAKGVKGFKKSMTEEDEPAARPAARLPSSPTLDPVSRAVAPDRPAA